MTRARTHTQHETSPNLPSCVSIPRRLCSMIVPRRTRHIQRRSHSRPETNAIKRDKYRTGASRFLWRGHSHPLHPKNSTSFRFIKGTKTITCCGFCWRFSFGLMTCNMWTLKASNMWMDLNSKYYTPFTTLLTSGSITSYSTLDCGVSYGRSEFLRIRVDGGSSIRLWTPARRATVSSSK